MFSFNRPAGISRKMLISWTRFELYGLRRINSELDYRLNRSDLKYISVPNWSYPILLNVFDPGEYNIIVRSYEKNINRITEKEHIIYILGFFYHVSRGQLLSLCWKKINNLHAVLRLRHAEGRTNPILTNTRCSERCAIHVPTSVTNVFLTFFWVLPTLNVLIFYRRNAHTNLHRVIIIL